MDTSKPTNNSHKKHFHPHDIEEAHERTHEMLNEGKKLASSLYKHGVETLDEAQAKVKEYSHTIWSEANKHPVVATVILGGVLGAIGALLYTLTRNK